MPTLKPDTPTLEDLKAIARRLKIKGFYRLTKCDLQKAIDAHGGSPTSKEEKKEKPKKKKIILVPKKAEPKARPKHAESPTIIDRAFMRQNEQFIFPHDSSSYTPFFDDSSSYIPFMPF